MPAGNPRTQIAPAWRVAAAFSNRSPGAGLDRSGNPSYALVGKSLRLLERELQPVADRPTVGAVPTSGTIDVTGQFLTFPANFLTAFADCISILETWSISGVAPRLLPMTVWNRGPPAIEVCAYDSTCVSCSVSR